MASTRRLEYVSVEVTKYNDVGGMTRGGVKLLTVAFPEVNTCAGWAVHTADNEVCGLWFSTDT